MDFGLLFGSSTCYRGSCLLNEQIVKLTICLVSSNFNHPIHQKPKSQWQNKLFGIGSDDLANFHGHNPHTQLCSSAHKCMFLTNVAPFKRVINWLSNSIKFIAKKYCYNKEIIYQTHISLLFELSLYIIYCM